MRVKAARSRPRRAALLSLIVRIGVLLQALQLRQRNDIAVGRPMPCRRLRGHVVIIETFGVLIEQLPPLRVVGAFDMYTLRRVPHAFARCQIGVHVLACAWLDDFHPFCSANGP